MDDLTARQKQILAHIRQEVQRKGYPPSVREIGAAVGLQSSSTVHVHLGKLERLGYIRRDPAKPRAIEVLAEAQGPVRPGEPLQVPIIGQVTAGEPILAEENIEGYFPIPTDFSQHEDIFLLRIQGDSMIDAGIFDQDYVLVERRSSADNGDIVVAMIDGAEATVKRFFHEGTQVRLQPENSAMAPIISNSVSILGKVIGLFRRIH